MDQNRIARLTDQQRACLRLVYAHMTSKEIAPLLGIEPNSVDQHIKAAMRVLGVGDRRAAARLLAEHEGAVDARRLVHQSLDIAAAPEPLAFDSSSADGRRERSRSSGEAMREEQAPFEVAPAAKHRRILFPLPIRGGQPSDLSTLQKLGWILVIMFAVALTFGMFVSGLEALSRLGRVAQP